MSASPSRSDERFSIIIAGIATLLLIGLGYIGWADLPGENDFAVALLGIAIVICAIVPAAGVAAVAVAIPFYELTIALPWFAPSVLEIAMITATVGMMLRAAFRLVRAKGPRTVDAFTPPHLTVPVVLGIAAVVVSVVVHWESRTNSTIPHVRTVVIEPLMLLLTARLVFRAEVYRRLTGIALLVAAIGVSTWSLVEFFRDIGDFDFDEVTRFSGPFADPADLASYLVRSSLFTLGAMMVRPRWWWLWPLAFIQIVGLVLAFSGGSVIALAVGFAALLLLNRRWSWSAAIVLLGVGFVTASFWWAPDRARSFFQSGIGPRLESLWSGSIEMLRDNPVFGVGFDAFGLEYQQRYVEAAAWSERFASHTHNFVLDVWLRTGVLGIAALFSLISGVVWWTANRSSTMCEDPWSTGALTALVGGVTYGMLDQGLFRTDLAAFTTLLLAMVFTVRPRVDGVPSATPPGTQTQAAKPWPERTWPAQYPPTNQAR